MLSEKKTNMGWREGSTVKSTCYFCKRCGFGSQNPYQVAHSINSNSLDLMPSSGIFGYNTLLVYIQSSRVTHTYTYHFKKETKDCICIFMLINKISRKKHN